MPYFHKAKEVVSKKTGFCLYSLAEVLSIIARHYNESKQSNKRALEVKSLTLRPVLQKYIVIQSVKK